MLLAWHVVQDLQAVWVQQYAQRIQSGFHAGHRGWARLGSWCYVSGALSLEPVRACCPVGGWSSSFRVSAWLQLRTWSCHYSCSSCCSWTVGLSCWCRAGPHVGRRCSPGLMRGCSAAAQDPSKCADLKTVVLPILALRPHSHVERCFCCGSCVWCCKCCKLRSMHGSSHTGGRSLPFDERICCSRAA